MKKEAAAPEQSGRLDKRILRELLAAVEKRMGIVRDPDATAEKVQAMMLASGIRPEDCILSRDIIRQRREGDPGE